MIFQPKEEYDGGGKIINKYGIKLIMTLGSLVGSSGLVGYSFAFNIYYSIKKIDIYLASKLS